MRTKLALAFSASIAGLVLFNEVEYAQSAGALARDPGVRAGLAAAGMPLPLITARELAFFNAGKTDFNEVEAATDGLGPRMNLDSCGGCHSQPASGGSSPAVNPQVDFA